MAFEYRFNAITFYPKNEPPRFAPPEISEPFRFKNSSGWFCGLYIFPWRTSLARNYLPVWDLSRRGRLRTGSGHRMVIPMSA